LDFNDIEGVARAFERNGKEIAAVIVEPVAGNMNLVLPRQGFIEGLRELCTRYGAVLIFDEVMTGFRVGPQGWAAACRWPPSAAGARSCSASRRSDPSTRRVHCRGTQWRLRPGGRRSTWFRRPASSSDSRPGRRV
jgi:glutamate-1-semialdehyde 2,1-aminomutase